MKIKKAIILSASSEIGFAVAMDFVRKGFQVVGTYNTESKEIMKLKNSGVKLYKLNLLNKKKIDQISKKIDLQTKNKWDYFISFAGTLNPINKIIQSQSDTWEKSVYVNCLGQIRFLKNLLRKNNKKRKIIFFSGGAYNAASDYSAYTLSKTFLIKYVELLDFEEKLLNVSILGPGFINTKLHKKKEKIHTIKKINKIKKVIKCISWILSQSKNLVSGRNFSLVHDSWGTKKMEKLLKTNKNIYKLRRYGNDLKT